MGDGGKEKRARTGSPVGCGPPWGGAWGLSWLAAFRVGAGRKGTWGGMWCGVVGVLGVSDQACHVKGVWAGAGPVGGVCLAAPRRACGMRRGWRGRQRAWGMRRVSRVGRASPPAPERENEARRRPRTGRENGRRPRIVFAMENRARRGALAQGRGRGREVNARVRKNDSQRMVSALRLW